MRSESQFPTSSKPRTSLYRITYTSLSHRWWSRRVTLNRRFIRRAKKVNLAKMSWNCLCNPMWKLTALKTTTLRMLPSEVYSSRINNQRATIHRCWIYQLEKLTTKPLSKWPRSGWLESVKRMPLEISKRKVQYRRSSVKASIILNLLAALAQILT